MTTFEGGPADNVTLMLRRAPLFLRVVIDPAGEVDALDIPGDKRKDGERVYVYQRRGNATVCFVSARGRGGTQIGGQYAMAKYEYLTAQPGTSILNDNGRWQQWCLHQRKAQEAN